MRRCIKLHYLIFAYCKLKVIYFNQAWIAAAVVVVVVLMLTIVQEGHRISKHLLNIKGACFSTPLIRPPGVLLQTANSL